MRVYHSRDIRAFLIYPQVHLHLGGRTEPFRHFQHLSRKIQFTELLRLHKTLGNARGRTDQLILRKPHRNIAVVCRHHAPPVHPSPDLTYFLPNRFFIPHAFPPSDTSFSHTIFPAVAVTTMSQLGCDSKSADEQAHPKECRIFGILLRETYHTQLLY